MNRSSVAKVLIVGGGVGGMGLAIMLRKVGVNVDLIDIDPGWRAVGAGLTLNGATLRAFDRLGVLEDVMESGHVHGGRRSYHIDGTMIRDIPAYVPEPGDLHAGGGILRPALHAILSAKVHAAGAVVKLGMTVDRLDQRDDHVEALLSNGDVAHYDLVVGADGIMSRVRKLAFPDAPVPTFTGQGCWRAVFDRPKDVETSWIFLDPSHKVGFNPVSADKMYMFMLESAPGNPWREPSHWPEMLADRMRRYGGLVGELAERVSEESLTNYRPLETLLLPSPWHRGRVVLLGDAAHATTPHAGYGAGLAIEDGIVLADELASSSDLAEALQTYADRRYPRCAAVLGSSLALGEMEMASAPAADQLAASAALFDITRAPF